MSKSSVKKFVRVFTLAFGAVIAASSYGQSVGDAARGVLASAVGDARPELGGSSIRLTKEGYVSFIAAAPGQHIPLELSGDRTPEGVALAFVAQNAAMFGCESPRIAFSVGRVVTSGSVTYVHLKQSYGGTSVYGGTIVVAVYGTDGVLSALADVMTQTSELDSRADLDSYRADNGDLRELAVAHLMADAEAYGGGSLVYQLDASTLRYSDEKNVIYAPEVAETEFLIPERKVAAPVLARSVTINDDSGRLGGTVILDAVGGELLSTWPTARACIDRRCYNQVVLNPVNKRLEGDGASGITQVNTVYDLMWHVHTYFSVVHGWDDWYDNCSPIWAVVNSNYVNNDHGGLGAYFYAGKIEIGSGWVSEDVVAHEYTHGVVLGASNLGYTNHAAALFEGFSDMWGEFNDINISNDGSNNWLVGQSSPIGYFRNMAHPHSVPCGIPQGPEIFEECGYWETDSTDLYSYSHTNMMVAAKLCHLLAQGDSSFRGSSYTALDSTLTTSVYATSRLMFAVMQNLPETATYCDFRLLVRQTAVNGVLGVIDLGPDITWNATALQKVENALAAVNLSPTQCLRCDGTNIDDGDEVEECLNVTYPALCTTDNIDTCP